MKKQMPQLSVGFEFPGNAPFDQGSVHAAMRALQRAGVWRVSLNPARVGVSGAKISRVSALAPFGVECFGSNPNLAAALRLKPDWILLDTASPLATLKRNLSLLRERRIRAVLRVRPTRQDVDHAIQLKVDEIQICVSGSVGATQRSRLVALALRIRKSGVGVSLSGSFTQEQIRILSPSDVFDTFHVDSILFGRAWEVGIERAARELVTAAQAP